jgi:hypothetical protein
MIGKGLTGLCLRVWSGPASEDIALIFADPTRNKEALPVSCKLKSIHLCEHIYLGENF